MAEFEPRTTTTGFGSVPRAGGAVVFDEGLRKHMLSIYNYMTSGVLLTGIVALLAYNSGLAINFARGPLMWIVALSPLAIVFAMSFGANRFSKGTLQLMFWAFAALMGLSMSTIFLVFTGGSIAVTFFATAAAFAGLSLFGYTTKKDLTGFGSFLIIGLFGLIIASLVNMFLHNGMMGFIISVLGVFIFAGLIAYDTQRLKMSYYEMGGDQTALGVATNYGALNLYLNFINLFQFLLSIFGDRR